LLIEAEHRRSLELGTGGWAPTLEAIKAKEKAERFAVPSIRNIQAGEEHEVASAAPAMDDERTDRRLGRDYAAEPTVTPGMGLREAGEIWLAAKWDWKRRKPKTPGLRTLHYSRGQE